MHRVTKIFEKRLLPRIGSQYTLPAKKPRREDGRDGRRVHEKMADGAAFDPETIALLRAVLDEAWDSLNAQEQAQSSKTLLAERILHLAATGERDPVRLRVAALTEVVTPLLRQQPQRQIDG